MRRFEGASQVGRVGGHEQSAVVVGRAAAQFGGRSGNLQRTVQHQVLAGRNADVEARPAAAQRPADEVEVAPAVVLRPVRSALE